ncbi:hypothetical protein HDU76_007667, partial [Blyttiomyces sp. JEL0837]
MTMSTTTSSLWDCIPSELEIAIFRYVSILTRFMNNILTAEEIEIFAIDIWNEVFESDWQGDLSILPPHPFPTATTGLCKVHSRSMYNRLVALRPHLAYMDAVKVLVHDDTRYGFFENSTPIIKVTEEEEDLDLDVSVVGQFGEPVVIEGTTWKDIETALSKLLIQIAMRQCWIDVLGAYIDRNPTNMATIAVLFNHLELLKWIFQHHKDRIDMKIWMEKFDSLSYSIRNRNVTMFKMLFGLAKLEAWFTNIDPTATANRLYALDLRAVNRSLCSSEGFAILDMLEYDRDRYSRTLLEQLLSRGFRQGTPLALWERILRLRNQLDWPDTILPTPAVTNMNEARAVVAKMGSVPYDVLEICSASGDLEMFSYLWEHRDRPPFSPTMDDHWDAFSQDMMTLPPQGVKWAFAKFIQHYDMQFLTEYINEPLISLDAIRYITTYREMGTAPGTPPPPLTDEEKFERREFFHCCMKHFLERSYLNQMVQVINLCKCDACLSKRFSEETIEPVVMKGNLYALQFLYKHGFKFATPIINIAARHGQLEIVCWFHGLAPPFNVCTTAAMDSAAASGHYRVVEWLHQHRTEGCTVDAMDNASKNGFYRVVKFLYEKRQEGCSSVAINDAAINGHLRTLKYLFDKVPGVKCPLGILKNVCDRSQSTPNALAIVEYLTTNYLEVVKMEFDLVYEFVIYFSKDVRDFLKKRELEFRGFVGKEVVNEVKFRR